MRRHFLTRIAVLGPLLALAAYDDADTNEFVTIASTAHSAPDAEPGNGKASIFRVPREAWILFW
jgi:hypothetical protein